MQNYAGKLLMGGAVRTRQLRKTFQNFLLTMVCGFTTILVLKGSTGFENPSSFDDQLEPPAHSQNPYFFTNRHRPLIKSENLHSQNPYSFLTNRDRPLVNPYFLTNHDRSLHRLANAHSQIPDFPTNSDRPSSGLSSIRSELQHARFLAEVNNIIHISQAHDLADAVSTEKEFDSDSPDPNPNPESISTVYANPAPNPHLNLPEPEQSSTRYKPSILLVTGSQPFACGNPMGDHYLMKSLKNKMDYCRLHNLEIFYNMANLDPQMSGFWAKLPVIYTLMLAHPEKEWLWWVDSDAMITDMAFELPMDRYKDYNLVLHGWKELVYEEKNWVGLNTGSFLIRNCEWSLNLLEAWAPMGLKGKAREEAGKLLSKALTGRPKFEADDQSALIYLLNEQKSKWASKVYLENAYYLHGYWLIIVDKYEEMMERYHSGLGDERWPFVTHFVGCKPCSNNKLPLEEKCLEHMERAFNFADNQVLQFYGFHHEALNTHTLVKSTSH